MRDGTVPSGDMTKEEAAALQSEEAQMSGTGEHPASGVVAKAQSMADKNQS